MMRTVYGRATSSNVQALIWGLEELGLTYERLDYGEVFGGLDTDAFKALNPHRKIPVLVDQGQVIWETPAILRYLAAEYGTEPFWPASPLARAKVDMWAEWAKHSVAEAFTGPVFWRTARTKPENRDPGLIAANLARFDQALDIAEAQLAGQSFLCGPDLTLADIQFGHVLYRYFDIDIPRPKRAALAAYYARLTSREAYRKAVIVSYEALRETF